MFVNVGLMSRRTMMIHTALVGAAAGAATANFSGNRRLAVLEPVGALPVISTRMLVGETPVFKRNGGEEASGSGTGTISIAPSRFELVRDKSHSYGNRAAHHSREKLSCAGSRPYRTRAGEVGLSLQPQ